MRQPSAGVGGRGDAGFVRADQIDLKSLDEQLERHLGRPPAAAQPGSRRGESTRLGEEPQLLQQHRHREAWEIDPSKLVIKGVIARSTFSTVQHGVYDGQDVAVKLLDWGEDGHRSEQEIAALRAAFAQVVSVWHKLDHPNVTKFIGAIMGARDLNVQTEHGHLGMPSNICCIVVDYLAGGSLKSFLIKNRRRKLAFKVVVQIALDLARAQGVSGGRDSRPIGAYELAKAVEELGAGEMLLNCIDCDGQGCGFDIDLIKMVSDAVTIPVIASSGAGAVEHFSEVFEKTNASAALAAGTFHWKEVPIQSVKEHLVDAGVEVRM